MAPSKVTSTQTTSSLAKPSFGGERIDQRGLEAFAGLRVVVEHPRRIARLGGRNGQLARA
jgi:hypothetical protein